MDPRNKIKSLEQLVPILANYNDCGQKVVHCHGVFDLLHIGHIRHFQQAKRLGDVLVVTLTRDEYVNKGPDRPAFSQDLRAEAVAALNCVDYVSINRWPTAVETIRLLRPALYVKGSDYQSRAEDITGKITEEEEAIREVGGQLIITDDIVFSSSKLINGYLSGFTEEQSNYLDCLREKYSAKDVFRWLDRARDLRVLVVGETIIDDYHYCEAIGKAGKEPVLVARHVDSEKFVGGVLAIANHLASFCGEVGVLSFLGTDDTHLEFIKCKLKSNITPYFLFLKNGPTILKRRFVEHYLLQKLFEVYFFDPESNQESDELALLEKLDQLLPGFDMVVAADYGHGMLTGRAIQKLCREAKHLSVNTQANAGNTGYHTISAYPRADYVCLANHELAMDLRCRKGDIEAMIKDVVRRLSCPRVTITRGKYGIISYCSGTGFARGPAFTQHVTDRIGSGDAVLSVTSLLAFLGAEPDLLVFAGNIAGSEAVRTLGHRSFLERVPFYRHISTLLK